MYLLLGTPLALLPFNWALLVFMGGSLLAYLAAMHRLLPRAAMAFLGFPGVAMTLLFGQNGLLTTALFGGALAVLARRPVLAGMFFGGLCYKPQLGVVVPLALLATRQWRAFTAAAATVAALIAASATAFGVGSWRAFLAGVPVARQTLEHGLANNASWVSTFRAVLQAGGGVEAGYAVQAVVTIGACVAMVAACRRRPDAITGVLPIAALLSTPFLLVYDLTLLAVPLAWVVSEARHGGFLRWEKAVLGMAYVLPLLSPLGARLGLPLGPPAMLVLFAVVLRRAWLAPPCSGA